MTTETMTVAVTQAAQETLRKYEPYLEEHLDHICPFSEPDEKVIVTEAVQNILHIVAAGTADIVVKAFSYAFNMDDEKSAS